jgi:5-methyltetrahydrofolate--homocysteine methyltransferase
MADLVAARNAADRDDLLLLAQSNAGMPQLRGDAFVDDAGPQDLAGHSVRLRRLGVDCLGACCGSTPVHIAAMHSALGR